MPSSSASSRVLSVNLARVRPRGSRVTGIDKVRVDHPVEVRPPGGRAGGLGSGLVGDTIGNRRYHGGDAQAVYAYAREDLDHWEQVLCRSLPSGTFGENLTTVGVDLSGAQIGERWRLGDTLELEVTRPRTPCATFRAWMDEAGWLKTFTAAALPGAYLCVVTAGHVANDDPIVVHRPGDAQTIADAFRERMGPGRVRAGTGRQGAPGRASRP